MSLSAAVLDAMLAAGCTAEQIVAAVKAASAEDEGRREAKRAGNAERQRRFKAKRIIEVTPANAGNALPSVTPSLSPSSFPQTPNQHPHTHPDITPARKGRGSKIPPPAKPDGVQDQTWADFLDLRARKRADVTETAILGLQREAEKAGWSLEEAICETVTQGWQGFRADWIKERGLSPPGRQPPAAQPTDLVQSILRKRA